MQTSIQILPLELLADIFILCVDFDLVNDNICNYPIRYVPTKSSLNLQDSPWNLSHVNSMWRQLALSYCKLWSVLGIVVTDSSCVIPSRYNGLYSLAALQLARTGDSIPLQLSYCNRMKVKGRTISMISEPMNLASDPIIRLIATYTARWSTMYFWSWQGVFQAIETAGNGAEFLSLHSIFHRGQTLNSTPIPKLFFTAPNLRRIGVCPLTVRNHTVPWSQMEHYESIPLGHPATEEEYVSILSQMPNLITANIFVGAGLANDDHIPLALHHLTGLQIGYIQDAMEYEPGRRLLRCLTLPHLTDLSFFNIYMYGQTVVELIQRSGCKITSLGIHPSNVAILEVRPVLEALPFLEKLTCFVFNHHWARRELLTLLHEQDPMLLPLLKEIHMKGSYNATDGIEPSLWQGLKRLRPHLKVFIHDKHLEINIDETNAE